MGPEKRFENQIKNYIEEQGGWQIKFFANKMTKKGVPDILACINGYFLAIEVKSENGHPSELQIEKIQKIRKSGGQAFVLYPSGFFQFQKIVKDMKNDLFYDIPIILK